MKKIIEITIGIVFVISAFFLFYQKQYGLGVILILSLIILYKIDLLTEFAFNFKNGFNAKFNTFPKKIEENIIENEEPITNQNFSHFRNVEIKILSMLQKRYGSDLKTLVHFMYGQSDKPEFRYTPDGSLQTDEALYFFEIKYILKPEFAKNIVGKTLKYLEEVYKRFSPSMGEKKLIIKLILSSEYDLSDMVFDTPVGIEIEFYKI